MAKSDTPTEPGYLLERHARPAKKNRAAMIGTAIGTALVVAGSALSYMGVFSAPARAGEPSTKAEKVPRSLDEKIDGLVMQQAEMAGDVKDIKKIQSAQTTDIAVIKRQLGLDGLGPPPTRASGIGR
jgi:hypothetical protein